MSYQDEGENLTESGEKNLKISIVKNRRLLFYFAVGLILSVSFFASVSAQNKVVTEEEVKTILSNAEQKLKQKSYRSITVDKFGKNEQKATYIYEFVPPNREHFIFNTFVLSLNSPYITNTPAYDEWIYIGKKIYYRNAANKKWKEIAPGEFGGNSGRTGTGTSSDKTNETIEYKLTPNQLVNQQECDLYEVITIYKYSSNYEPFVYNKKYWINKNGLFAKTQFIDSPLEETTVEYEYDSNIKIVAPRIQKRTKRSK